MREPPSKLSAVEGVRGVAATAVVLYHAARHLDKAYGAPELMRPFQWGHAGVDVFFVLSGFIILFVHRADIGRPQQLRRYARQRFTRVAPPYWVALLLTIAMGWAGGQGLPTAANAIWSASLLPSFHEPILGIAWTLQHELVFYLVFATLILSRLLGGAVLGLWLVWIGAAASGLAHVSAPAQFYSAYNLEFFFGMAVAAAVRRGIIPYPRAIAAAGAVLLVAAAAAESLGALDGYGDLARLAYGLPAALLLGGLGAWERDRGLSTPRPLRTLGAASYSIYLFQFIFIGLVWKVWQATPLDRPEFAPAAFVALAAAGVGGGIAMSRLVEQPLLRWIRARTTPKLASAAADRSAAPV